VEFSATVSKFAPALQKLQTGLNWVVGILARIVLAKAVDAHTGMGSCSAGNLQMLLSAPVPELAVAL
jgi:hypothetical protein